MMRTKEKRGLSNLLKSLDDLYVVGVDKERPPKFRKRSFKKIAKRMYYLSKVKQLQQSYPNLKPDDRKTRDIIKMVDSMKLAVIAGKMLGI